MGDHLPHWCVEVVCPFTVTAQIIKQGERAIVEASDELALLRVEPGTAGSLLAIVLWQLELAVGRS